MPQFVEALRPIEWRYTNDPAWVMRDKGERLDHNRVWLKADGPMPDDPLLHIAALVYASDTTVLDSIITTHGLSWGYDRIFAATVNHSVWFHRPIRFDEWVLYSTTSPVAADSRGLGTGHFFDQSGQMRGYRGAGRNHQVLPGCKVMKVATGLRARERVVVHVDSPAARWISALAVLSLSGWLFAPAQGSGLVNDHPERPSC